MKNLTITTAIKLGFDFENTTFNTVEEMEKEILEFLHENQDKIKKVENHFCEVTQHGNSQNVSFGDFTSSGDIIHWSDYSYKRKQRIYHSEFMDVNKDGSVVRIKLYCFSK